MPQLSSFQEVLLGSSGNFVASCLFFECVCVCARLCVCVCMYVWVFVFVPVCHECQVCVYVSGFNKQGVCSSRLPPDNKGTLMSQREWGDSWEEKGRCNQWFLNLSVPLTPFSSSRAVQRWTEPSRAESSYCCHTTSLCERGTIVWTATIPQFVLWLRQTANEIHLSDHCLPMGFPPLSSDSGNQPMR